MLVALGERHRADGLLELVGEVARPGLGVPHLARGVRGTGDEGLGVLGHVARPHGAVVADVRANALAVVGVPQCGVVILGAREQEVALLVVLDERQRPARLARRNVRSALVRRKGRSRVGAPQRHFALKKDEALARHAVGRSHGRAIGGVVRTSHGP